jgi:hypothetical protein
MSNKKDYIDKQFFTLKGEQKSEEAKSFYEQDNLIRKNLEKSYAEGEKHGIKKISNKVYKWIFIILTSFIMIIFILISNEKYGNSKFNWKYNNKYSLTINVLPKEDSQIQLMNILPIYEDGIKLPNGSYVVRITNKRLNIIKYFCVNIANQDKNITINLIMYNNKCVSNDQNTKLHKLIINKSHSNTRIQIMNIKPLYIKNIFLESCTYVVRASNKKLCKIAKYFCVEIKDQDVTYDINLR